jgi:hypothetical protein
MAELCAKTRLRLLLDHFGRVEDPRDLAKVRFTLSEFLFLVSCGTIAGGGD